MIDSFYSNMNDFPVRKIEGKVEFYKGSTLLNTFLATDNLQEITVSRAGENGKFFGFGICQQATVKIVDKLNEVIFQKNETLLTSFKANSNKIANYERVCPTFYVKSAERDETTNTITVTAYDALDSATGHTFSELGITAPYTIKDVVERISSFLGLSGVTTIGGFDTLYENGANFSGDETLRAVLNYVAEATFTIYYVDHNDKLVFRILNPYDAALTINKKDYFELTTSLPVTLTKIVSATELGDNVYYGFDTGVTQYVRDNPFWTNRTDLDTYLIESINAWYGKTMVPYSIKWRGNFLTEIGDNISIEAKDGNLVTTYLLNDTLTYNGGFSQTSSWEYSIAEKETVANPVTIGEKINQTYARVDKINKRIDLVASNVSENSSQLAELKLTTDDITLRVEKVENQEFDLDLENDANFIALTERVGQLEISDTNIIASVTALETKTSTDLSTAVSNLETVISNNNTELTNTLRAEIEAGDGEIITEVNTVKSELGELKVSTDAITLRVKDLEETTIDLDTDESFIALTNRVGALEVSDTQINASISNTETIVKKYTDDAITGVESDLSTLEETLRGELTAGDEALGGEITTIKQDISTLQIESSGISANVKSLESSTTDSIDALNNTVSALTKEVNLKVDSDAVNISINKALSEGINKVKTTSKNYTFDDKGLKIESSDSEFNTTVDENGMRIYNYDTEVLTVNNQGVKAADLHARTFLIIGENSRLEDRGRRTACFWIGPAEE